MKIISIRSSKTLGKEKLPTKQPTKSPKKNNNSYEANLLKIIEAFKERIQMFDLKKASMNFIVYLLNHLIRLNRKLI